MTQDFMDPEIYAQICEYLRPAVQVEKVAYDLENGRMDLQDLTKKLAGGKVAAVFYENPSYLGFWETQAVKMGKSAIHGQQLLVRARFDDPPCIHHDDAVSVLNG